MTLAEVLPSWNAAMNAASACALFAGWGAIRRGNRALHWKLMSVAFGASVLFLAGYLTRFALTGVHRFPRARDNLETELVAGDFHQHEGAVRVEALDHGRRRPDVVKAQFA